MNNDPPHRIPVEPLTTSRRSGSNRRHRKWQVAVRLDDAEYDKLISAAARTGKTPPALLRQAFLLLDARGYVDDADWLAYEGDDVEH